MNTPITVALSKGRILKDTLPLLAHAGITLKDDPFTSRKLIFETSRDDVSVIVIRAADVPTFVENGAADLGVAGKDVLMEYGGNGLYEPLDLNIARCRLMTAGRKGWVDHGTRLRIATKYVETARRYYAARGIQVEVVKLYGSMELAPLVGLADCIVDLVDTGNTLKANGLVPMETIAEISSRLIVNKASMKMKHEKVKQLIGLLAEAVANQETGG
ncbi:MAG TPA: ATP phosphoribosyltransferase [Gammaproteobacteria bacterium]|nr:ATP phosphoribosyltransferase [Gammaproteobacteria bacterium]